MTTITMLEETGFISEKESHSSVFETTHIISSKTLSQYEDFPFSTEVADYPSHKEITELFSGLRQKIQLISFNQV